MFKALSCSSVERTESRVLTHAGCRGLDDGIVGCGPVGAVAATLLGLKGLRVLVLERDRVGHACWGCDGARSTVRRLAGIGLTGDSYPERWLAVSGQPADERTFLGAAPHEARPGRSAAAA